jgi:hypothetical protein
MGLSPGVKFNVHAQQMRGMTPNERALAHSFLSRHAHEYDLIVFQRPIGKVKVHRFEERGMVFQWPLSTWSPRPDFVAWSGDIFTIGEIKRTISFSTVGQVAGYARLCREHGQGPGPVRYIVIGHDANPGVEDAIAKFGFELCLLPDVEMIPFT